MSKNAKPAVVAIGGGHGLATVLGALKLLDVEISAIVSVADNGGSSGKLSADYEVPALGDIRRCISSLASEEDLLVQTLESRFVGGALDNHPTGNLILAGLLQTSGSFQAAINELLRLTQAVGRVFPAASSRVNLSAQSKTGGVSGQVAIEEALAEGLDIEQVSADDQQVVASTEALDAVNEADSILIGPGSFHTSVLGALVARNLVEAIAKNTAAKKILIANISIDSKGQDDFDPQTQIELLAKHGVNIDLTLCPEETSPESQNHSITNHKLLNEDRNRHSQQLLSQVLSSFITQD